MKVEILRLKKAIKRALKPPKKLQSRTQMSVFN